MTDLENIKIGFAVTGSFCTFEKAFEQAEALRRCGAELIPIMSYNAARTDTRFGTAQDNLKRLENICSRKVITTIEDAEPIGPKAMTDIMLVAPCTGNTCAKLAMSITDTPVTMAVKSHLRNKKPVVLAIATNDSLSGSMKNIGKLLNMKNYFFVPFYQDDCKKKPTSAICDFREIPETVSNALSGVQSQPIIGCSL